MNTDEKGNKLPQPSLPKARVSKTFRQLAKGRGNHCSECGYLIRGQNHLVGKHHKAEIAK